jgi:hypothetical protein
MALAAQQQVRQMYVGSDYPQHSTISALRGGTDQDLAVLGADGSAVAAGEKFKLYKKTTSGDVSSDVIDPSQILYSKSVAYAAEVLKVSTISALTVDVNSLYTVEIAIDGFGSLSAEDEYIKKAFYKAVTGNDQEAIVDGLIVSLNRNFQREIGSTSSSNDYFTFSKTGSGTSAALVITEKTAWRDKYYSTGKKTRSRVSFRVNAAFTTLPTIVETGGSVGVGEGHQVVDMEYYLKGERNDFYRGAGYPHNLENSYDALYASNYNLVEIGYWEEGRDEAKKSKKQVTIAVPFTNLAGNATLNLLIADLNTILGSGSVDALATS